MEVTMGFGRGALLWFLGVPIPIIILVALFWHHWAERLSRSSVGDSVTNGRMHMIKSLMLGVGLVAATAFSAGAQERRVIEERPAITVPLPVPSVEVEKRERVERREVETTGRGGCDSKTVRKEGPEGSKTVTKERCDWLYIVGKQTPAISLGGRFVF
jgi:hypothetical protein